MIENKFIGILKKDASYKLINNKLIFNELTVDEYNEDQVNSFKSFIKKNNKLYELLIDIVSPVYTFNTKRHLKDTLKKFNQDSTIINLGSGNSTIGANIFNVDIFAYDNVDIVCDIESLPFEDNSIDLIINLAVLEHVPHPDKVISEIYRVLKYDGVVFSTFPFMQGFHASPYDFSRRTSEGLKVAYAEFSGIELKNAGGPTSGFLWILQEWLAIVFSFGIRPLHSILTFLLMLTTFPLKFLDFIYVHHPLALNICSAFTLIATKKRKT